MKQESGKAIKSKSLKHILFFAIFILFSIAVNAQESGLQKQARTLINLLDYVSQDYAKAVNNGKVINDNEYNEMLEFSGQAISLFDTVSQKVNVPNKEALKNQLIQLLLSIKNKDGKQVIAVNAQQIKKQLLLLNLIDIRPAQYPDITQGRILFRANCQSCHGVEGAGNGPLASGFTPPPASFLDDSLMQDNSPLQVFNTARLGVQGTGMRAFDELSDKQLWETAFYIKSLRFQNKFSQQKDSLIKIFNRSQPTFTLSDISRLSDNELLEKLGTVQNEMAVAAIRLHEPLAKEKNSLSIALENLDDALTFYKNNHFASAEQKALYAYLDGIEPVEQQLAATDASIVPELENKMNEVRSAINAKKPYSEVSQKITSAKSFISKASSMLTEQTYSFWLSFLIASSILLREGLEAVLIIITILSLLKSLKAADAAKWVHFGWLTAVMIGIASWFFTGWLISFGAQNREIMEGIGAVLAVIMLMYIGFWLHNKTEAKKWKEFVEVRVAKILDQKKMFALSFIAFIVVFREAFESVIFLSSLQLQVEESNRNGVWMGALAAIAAVILIAYLLLRSAVKIPIRQLFKYSAILMQVLAFVLAGQGTHAFQESGLLSVTSIPLNFHFPILGIYPTAETYISQAIVLLITFLLWRRGKKLIPEVIKQ